MLGPACSSAGSRAVQRGAFSSLSAGRSFLLPYKLCVSSTRESVTATASAAAPSAASSSSGSSSSHRLHVAPSASSAAHSQQQRLSAQELLDEKLYEEIRACETWADVLDVVQDEGEGMSTKRLVQALARMGTLLKAAKQQERSEAINSEGFKGMMQLLYAKLPSLKASQACAVAMTLGQLRVKPPAEQLQRLWEVLHTHALQYSARDVATIMHASVALGAAPRNSAHALLDALATRAVQLLQPAASSADADNAGDQHDQQASSSSSSSAGPQAQQQAEQRDAFTPQGLSMVMVSAAHLRLNNMVLLSAAAKEAHRQLAGFTPQGVANVLWACASLEAYYPELAKASLEYFAARRGSFKAQEVSNIAWALTKLRHHPQQYSQALTAALLSQPEGGVRPADLASILQMLATFCVVPGKQTMDELCRRLDAVIPKSSAAELCNCLWALGLLGETSRPQFSRIAAALPPHFERGELDDGLLRQAFQALLCATLTSTEQQQQQANAPSPSGAASPATPSPSSSSPVPAFPPLMLDTMKRLWISTIQAGAARAERHMSPTKMVSQIIEKLRVRHDAARATRDGLVLIDIALRPSETRYVALQVLRPFDHTRNTDQLLGSAQLERQILEKNGWEVKYLLSKDLGQIAPEAQLFFIAEYLKSIGCRIKKSVPAPGASGKQVPDAERVNRSAPSQAAREANILLNDPRVKFSGKGKRS